VQLLASLSEALRFDPATGNICPRGDVDGLADIKIKVKTVFISDIHLGFRGSRPDHLLRFLRQVECEKIVLVGDVIDLWVLGRRWHWKEDCNRVLREILRRAASGTEVIYVPGNHDDAFRRWVGTNIAQICIEQQHVHETLDGRRMLVLHGDEFDQVVRRKRWVASLGHLGYELSMYLNHFVNGIRWLLRKPYWSLSAYLRAKVKQRAQDQEAFERAVAEEARRNGCEMALCGHTHNAKHAIYDGTEYWNDGDWVETLSSVIEFSDGRIELIHWPRDTQQLPDSFLEDTNKETNEDALRLEA